MTRHEIFEEAIAELREAAAWYEEQREGLGNELLVDYRARLARALDEPGVGVMTDAGARSLRRYRLSRFDRYAIVIVILSGIPTVVAFEHASRRPNYWRARLP
ncbi:hypothetical protein ACNOYE_24920 [Nannocystaceae bacterium ST9]